MALSTCSWCGVKLQPLACSWIEQAVTHLHALGQSGRVKRGDELGLALVAHAMVVHDDRDGWPALI